MHLCSIVFVMLTFPTVQSREINNKLMAPFF